MKHDSETSPEANQKGNPSSTGDDLPEGMALSPQQVNFFETFGFLKLPGLLSQEIGDIEVAFERVFEQHEAMETREHVHFGRTRMLIIDFVERDDVLHKLVTDPRILAIARSLLGPEFEYMGSDGNLLYCDTAWHCDIYRSPLDRYHIKVLVYLDPLRADSGAIRVLPGTNWYESAYAVRLRRDLRDWRSSRELFGLEPEQLPSWTIETTPGDVVVGNFRTIHATFGGRDRRRLFTLNYRQG